MEIRVFSSKTFSNFQYASNSVYSHQSNLDKSLVARNTTALPPMRVPKELEILFSVFEKLQNTLKFQAEYKQNKMV